MFSWAEVNTETPLHELIQMMPNTCWGPADLAGTVQYVRGCRDGMVMMSDQLKTIFPESMGDWCDPLETRMMDWGAGQKWCYIIPCTMLSVFKKSRFFRGALTRPKGALTQPKGAFTRPVILGEKICNLNFMLEISKTDHVSKGPAPFWLPWDLWYLATWSYMAKPLLHVCNYLLVPFGSWKQVPVCFSFVNTCFHCHLVLIFHQVLPSLAALSVQVRYFDGSPFEPSVVLFISDGSE